MKPSDNIVVLASGGMDSTVLLYEFLDQGSQVRPLFINYGQHCAETEIASLKKNAPKALRELIEITNVTDIYRHSRSRLVKEADLWVDDINADDLYLPYRNLLLLSIGAAYAQSIGAKALSAAFINSNHAKEIDCSAKFFTDLSGVLEEYGAIQLKMPFRNMSKADVALRGIELGVPITETFSCQANSSIPCGACPNCVDRLEALEQVRRKYGK